MWHTNEDIHVGAMNYLAHKRAQQTEKLYAYLLDLHQELCTPGRSGLVIPLETTGKELGSTSDEIRAGLVALKQVGMIYARKMDYPDTTPECWEIEFPHSEHATEVATLRARDQERNATMQCADGSWW